MSKSNWSTTYLKPTEVVLHNTFDDCWVSFLGIVKDLTELVFEFRNTPLIKPILAEAGKDITHWFNAQGEIQTYVHPVTGCVVPYLPHGKIPHLDQSDVPDTNWKRTPKIPWWKDEKYNVGRLTKNVRPIRILNVLTKKDVRLNVCEEETLSQIRDRYSPFNSNARSYTWKYQRRELDMDKTLDQNGIYDERPRFRTLGLPEDLYVPCLILYYNDDFN